MGKGGSKMSPKDLSEIAQSTNFNEVEVHDWYKGFMKDCPKGRMSKNQFVSMYQDFFPQGDSTDFALNIFRTFDENQDGNIDFQEFICALSVTSQGSVDDKLGWAFNIYDLDGNGFISLDEMREIIKTIYNTRPPKDRLALLGIKEKIEETFKKLDTNKDGKISRSEFVRGAKSDSCLVKILR